MNSWFDNVIWSLTPRFSVLFRTRQLEITYFYSIIFYPLYASNTSLHHKTCVNIGLGNGLLLFIAM